MPRRTLSVILALGGAFSGACGGQTEQRSFSGVGGSGTEDLFVDASSAPAPDVDASSVPAPPANTRGPCKEAGPAARGTNAEDFCPEPPRMGPPSIAVDRTSFKLIGLARPGLVLVDTIGGYRSVREDHAVLLPWGSDTPVSFFRGVVWTSVMVTFGSWVWHLSSQGASAPQLHAYDLEALVTAGDAGTEFVDLGELADVGTIAAGPGGLVYEVKSTRNVFTVASPTLAPTQVAILPERNQFCSVGLVATERDVLAIVPNYEPTEYDVVRAALAGGCQETLGTFPGAFCGGGNLAVGGGFVYVLIDFEGRTELRAVDVASGATHLVAAEAPDGGTSSYLEGLVSVAADDDCVYWGSNDGTTAHIYMRRHCGGATVQLASEPGGVGRMFVDDRAVYWTLNMVTTADPHPPRVMSVAKL